MATTQSPISLDSVTRVRQSGSVFSNPLANDLQKIEQMLNTLQKEVAALETAAGVTPVTPTAVSDFIFLPDPVWRDDGAMDVALQALTLASVPAAPAAAPQIIICTQATYPVLAGYPAVFVYVTDYAHIIYWDGTAGAFVGDNPGCLSLWESNPGVGYHLYDGTTVNYLKADGTTGSAALPDLTSAGALAAFLEGGGTNSGPTAPTAPTLAMDSYTPAGGVSAQILNGTPKTWDVVNVVSVGGTQSVLKDDATNNPYTPAGTITAGTVVGTPATLTGTISATGEPRKIVRRPYFRQ